MKPARNIAASLLSLIMLLPVILPAQGISGQTADMLRFSSCFAVTETDPQELEKVQKIIADPPCFRQCWITNAHGYLSLLFFPQNFSDQLRDCYNAQVAIRGAAEMYNAENVKPLRRISNELISDPDSPLMPEYLKFPFPRPTGMCRYNSIGDLSRGTLVIYCQYHGAPVHRPAE